MPGDAHHLRMNALSQLHLYRHLGYGRFQPHLIAILDPPTNPKHPTYWHSRSYGLFAANIFGEHDYYNDKSRNGSVTVEPGGSLRFRYRVVIHPGDTAEARIADLYKKYTEGR